MSHAVIAISAEDLSAHCGGENILPFNFRVLDDETTYSNINARKAADVVPGTVRVTTDARCADPSRIGTPGDQVRVIATWKDATQEWDAKGYLCRGGRWEEVTVVIAPMRTERFSRSRGILESDKLAGKPVAVFGVGAIGSAVGICLATAGVDRIILTDPDRVEVPNIMRQAFGMPDVSRFKVDAEADHIHEKNPFAEVETHRLKVGTETKKTVRDVVRRSVLVVGALGDPDATAILNKICVEEGKTLIVAGCYHRAFGGQILVVRPRITACYECFRKRVPRKAYDREIASRAQANRVAYADRPVTPEPGLHTDILPVCIMVVKLAIVELIRGQETALRSLEEDFVAPLFWVLNRREAGTEFEHLPPLGYDIDIGICRWYGVDLPRDPECPCCGDHTRNMAARRGITIDAAQVNAFRK